MRKIALREAKASLSAVVERAEHGESTTITKHGKPAAVIVPWPEWDRLRRVPSFGALLMAAPIEPGDLPPRRRTGLRGLRR
ncbi:MAG: type II toxin-antitoxin system Phd/YefM family antitoxin [Alphaproteobacteria bacterium]